MIMIVVAETVLLVAAGFLLTYLALLSVLTLFARRREWSVSPDKLRRFAIVVPAHNEELSLARTVRSLMAIEYPRKHFDVIVIADNCTDDTAAIAALEGATVWERNDPDFRGKGRALRWAFGKILSADDYDGVVVIDADTRVSKNLLSVMNRYLEEGSKAVQSSDMAEPQPGSWSSEITRLGFTLYNLVRPLGRSVIGCSAGIRGNGMCFAVDTLRTVPWNSFSLNEDLEYGLMLLLRGVNVEFAPEAEVFAMMPAKAGNAESQRARWEGGRFPVISGYGPRLLGQAFSTNSFRSLDAFIELITPAFVNLFGAAMFLFLMNAVLWLAGFDGFGIFAVLWGAAVSLGLFHVLVGLYSVGADRSLYRAFLYIPRYAVWKILLYTKLMRRGSTEEWVRTTRDHAVEAADRG